MLSRNEISFMMLFCMLTAGSMAIPSPDLMDYCPKCGMELIATDENNRNIYVPLERRTKKTGGGGRGSTPTMIKLPFRSKGGSGGSSKGASKGIKKVSGSSKGGSSAKGPIQAVPVQPTPVRPSPVAVVRPAPRPAATSFPPPQPTTFPSVAPSTLPSGKPSSPPSAKPSSIPSDIPSMLPSDIPSMLPSDLPSMLPSDMPSMVPSDMPSVVPSDMPSTVPSDMPSLTPSSSPSDSPSNEPTDAPSITESITSALPNEKSRTNAKASVIVGGSFVLLILLGSAIALRGSRVEDAVNGGGAPAPPAPVNFDLEEIALDD